MIQLQKLLDKVNCFIRPDIAEKGSWTDKQASELFQQIYQELQPLISKSKQNDSRIHELALGLCEQIDHIHQAATHILCPSQQSPTLQETEAQNYAKVKEGLDLLKKTHQASSSYLPLLSNDRLYLLDVNQAKSLPSLCNESEYFTKSSVVIDPDTLSTKELELYVAWQETKNAPTTMDDWLSLGKAAHFFGNDEQQVSEFFEEFVRGKIYAETNSYSRLLDQLKARKKDLGEENFNAKVKILDMDYCKKLLALLPSSEKLDDSLYLTKRGYSSILARFAFTSVKILVCKSSYAKIYKIVQDNESRQEIITKLHKLVGNEFSNAVNVLDRFGTWSIEPFPMNRGESNALDFFFVLDKEVMAKLFPKLSCFLTVFPSIQCDDHNWYFKRNISNTPIPLKLSRLKVLKVDHWTTTNSIEVVDENIRYDFTISPKKQRQRYILECPRHSLNEVSCDEPLSKWSTVLEAMTQLENVHCLSLAQSYEREFVFSPEQSRELKNALSTLRPSVKSLSLYFHPPRELSIPFPHVQTLTLLDTIIKPGLIKGSTELKELQFKNLAHQQYTGEGFDEIKFLKKLEKLTLMQYNKIFINHLKQVHSDSLKTLHIPYSAIPWNEHYLSKFVMSKNDINDFVDFLKQCPNLQNLKVPTIIAHAVMPHLPTMWEVELDDLIQPLMTKLTIKRKDETQQIQKRKNVDEAAMSEGSQKHPRLAP